MRQRAHSLSPLAAVGVASVRSSLELTRVWPSQPGSIPRRQRTRSSVPETSNVVPRINTSLNERHWRGNSETNMRASGKVRSAPSIIECLNTGRQRAWRAPMQGEVAELQSTSRPSERAATNLSGRRSRSSPFSVLCLLEHSARDRAGASSSRKFFRFGRLQFAALNP